MPNEAAENKKDTIYPRPTKTHGEKYLAEPNITSGQLERIFDTPDQTEITPDFKKWAQDLLRESGMSLTAANPYSSKAWQEYMEKFPQLQSEHQNEPIINQDGQLSDWIKKALPESIQPIVRAYFIALYYKANELTLDANGDIQSGLLDNIGRESSNRLQQTFGSLEFKKTLLTAMKTALREALKIEIESSFTDQETLNCITQFLLYMDFLFSHQDGPLKTESNLMEQLHKKKSETPDADVKASEKPDSEINLSELYQELNERRNALLLNPFANHQSLINQISSILISVDPHLQKSRSEWDEMINPSIPLAESFEEEEEEEEEKKEEITQLSQKKFRIGLFLKTKFSSPPTQWATLSTEGFKQVNKAKHGAISALGRCFNSAVLSPHSITWAQKMMNANCPKMARQFIIYDTAVNIKLAAKETSDPILNDKGEFAQWLKDQLPPSSQKEMNLFFKKFNEAATSACFTRDGMIQPWLIQVLGEDNFNTIRQHSNEVDFYEQLTSAVRMLLSESLLSILRESKISLKLLTGTERISEKMLKDAEKNNMPILIKKNDEFYIYGYSHANNQWENTKLNLSDDQLDLLKAVSFDQPHLELGNPVLKEIIGQYHYNVLNDFADVWTFMFQNKIDRVDTPYFNALRELNQLINKRFFDDELEKEIQDTYLKCKKGFMSNRIELTRFAHSKIKEFKSRIATINSNFSIADEAIQTYTDLTKQVPNENFPRAILYQEQVPGNQLATHDFTFKDRANQITKATIAESNTQNKVFSNITKLEGQLDTAQIMATIALDLFENQKDAHRFFTQKINELQMNPGQIDEKNLKHILTASFPSLKDPSKLASTLFKAYIQATEQSESRQGGPLSLLLITINNNEILDYKYSQLMKQAREMNTPILIKKDHKYLIYGNLNGKWEETTLSPSKSQLSYLQHINFSDGELKADHAYFTNTKFIPMLKSAHNQETGTYYFPSDVFIRLAKNHVDSYLELCNQQRDSYSDLNEQDKPQIIINKAWDPHYVEAVMLYCKMINLPLPQYDSINGWKVEPVTQHKADAFKKFYAERYENLQVHEYTPAELPKPEAEHSQFKLK